MEYLTTIDYVIFILLMIGGLWGAIKGAIDELTRKFGYVLGLLVGFMFTSLLAPVLVENLGFPYWFAAFLSYFVIFMFGYCLMTGLGTALSGISESSSLEFVDHFLGFVVGLLEAVLLIALAEYLLNYQNLFNLKSIFENSFLSNNIILPIGTWFVELFNSIGGGLV